MSKSTEADVLIIGGGPAGSAAAITCARAGLKVIVMEAASFPRDHPGETLHPAVGLLCERLGLGEDMARADFPRPDGHYIDCDGHTRFEPYGSDIQGPWLGYHAWRADFDAILLDGACKAGAKIWQRCAAHEVIHAGGCIDAVTSDRGIVRSRFLLDASGAANWLRKKLGLRVRQLSDNLTVKYGYRLGDLEEPNRPTFRIRHQGWMWAAQVRPGIVAWASLLHPRHETTNDLTDLVAGTTQKDPPRGANATWRILPESAGPGYFILGDAAAVLDPASSHGVLRAIASGMMAGHQVLRTCQGAIDDLTAATSYRNWLATWFERDAVELFGLYSKHSPALALAIKMWR